MATLKDLSTWGPAACKAELERLADLRPAFTAEAQGDLLQLAGFDQYRNLVAARLREVDWGGRKRKHKRPSPIPVRYADDDVPAPVKRWDRCASLGYELRGTFDARHVPREILREAIRNDSRGDVELLALGKPGGGIFEPRDRWRYE